MNTRTAPTATLTFTLMIALTALAGCKSGGGGSESNSSAPATVPSSNLPISSTPSTPSTAPANTAPTISGSAATSISVNAQYSFAPTSTDADGDQVTFQIRNKPSWATFSTVTGQLSGSPSVSNVGTYAGVVISASDGKASASLPAFSIAVTEPVAISAATTLRWTAPTQNTDGSQLTDLAGFIIMYGTSSTALTKSVRIDNPSVDQHVIDDLPAGRHYFGIKAITRAGVESAVSTTVSKVIG